MQLNGTPNAILPSPDELCPGCGDRVELTEAEIWEAFGRAVRVKAETLCEVAAYEQRMRVCGGCEALQNKTCRYCGCYVAVKAKFRTAVCPHPAGDKWGW